jgi:hypothetical protein
VFSICLEVEQSVWPNFFSCEKTREKRFPLIAKELQKGHSPKVLTSRILEEKKPRERDTPSRNRCSSFRQSSFGISFAPRMNGYEMELTWAREKKFFWLNFMEEVRFCRYKRIFKGANAARRNLAELWEGNP